MKIIPAPRQKRPYFGETFVSFVFNSPAIYALLNQHLIRHQVPRRQGLHQRGRLLAKLGGDFFMPGVRVRDGEPVEKALRIFKKQVEKAGIIGDLKKKQEYEKPSVRLKKKSVAARKRRAKQIRKFGYAD